MKRYIIAATLVAILSAGMASAQEKDSNPNHIPEGKIIKISRTPIYFLDGKLIENFDGSQLEGVLIRKYTIDKGTGAHFIFSKGYVDPTENDPEIIAAGTMPSNSKNINDFVLIGAGVEYADPEKDIHDVVFLVDGKRMTYPEFRSLSASSIKEIKVLRNDDPLTKKYADEGVKGVILVRTKPRK